jgi:hypothetical protein
MVVFKTKCPEEKLKFFLLSIRSQFRNKICAASSTPAALVSFSKATAAGSSRPDSKLPGD